MILTFLSPSADHPVGGVLAIFEFANAMARRGHEAHVVHLPLLGFRVHGPDDIAWASFEPSVQHHFLDVFDDRLLPHADFVFSSTWPIEATRGQPVVFVMGDPKLVRVLGPVYEAAAPKICISKWLVKRGAESGVPPEQLVYVPLGVRHDIFRLDVPVDQRPKQVTIQWSRFPAKRSDIALRALEIARSRFPELTAMAFGRGGGTSTPMRHLPDWVTLRESVSPEVLARDFYNASSIFLCTSMTEGFGNPSLESMACGCALVTTSNGGSDEYAIDGRTALICESNAPEVVADRIASLLADDEFRIGLAQRGHQYAARFDWDVAGERLDSFLRAYGADPSRYQRPIARKVEE
jgi:glycosyltransferase involved in cell wall biosynthesis